MTHCYTTTCRRFIPLGTYRCTQCERKFEEQIHAQKALEARMTQFHDHEAILEGADRQPITPRAYTYHKPDFNLSKWIIRSIYSLRP